MSHDSVCARKQTPSTSQASRCTQRSCTTSSTSSTLTSSRPPCGMWQRGDPAPSPTTQHSCTNTSLSCSPPPSQTCAPSKSRRVIRSVHVLHVLQEMPRQLLSISALPCDFAFVAHLFHRGFIGEFWSNRLHSRYCLVFKIEIMWMLTCCKGCCERGLTEGMPVLPLCFFLRVLPCGGVFWQGGQA